MKQMLKWFSLACLLALVLSCKKTVVHQNSGIYSDPKSLISEISDNFNLSHYDTALQVTGLDSLLAGKGPYTVFVVQDEAYPTLVTQQGPTQLQNGITYYTGGPFYGRINGLANYYYQYVQEGDIVYLKRLMTLHILPLNLTIAAIPFALNTAYPTLAGDSVYISKYIDPNSATPDTIVTVNGIRVTRGDFSATNGTYHVLNQLLFPAPNQSILDVISGSNALGWAFEPVHQETAAGQDTLGFGLSPYLYGLFTTALVRTGLDQLLRSAGPYTVMAVPDYMFFNPYSTSRTGMDLQTIDTMNINALTRLMKMHILKGRYFLSDFGSYAFNPNNLDTVYNPAFGTYTYSVPLAFPTIGGDTLYVIPNGTQLNSKLNGSSGFWLFGAGNLAYSPYTSLYQNAFAGAGVQDYVNNALNYNLYTLPLFLPQDVVAPNGVIQFLNFNELVPE
ncbi:MAG TPA: fasciclin domain-containing protein [Puia sp.]|nr:fasciclin domain-containing protein [Puia sp.]